MTDSAAAPHRFSARSVSLESGHAHGGARPIHFRRVRAGTPSTAFNFMDVVVVPPGADIGVHRHTLDNEETYVFLSGRGVMRLDEEEFTVEPGDVVVNRPGGMHGVRNNGTEPIQLLVIELKVPMVTVDR